MTITRNFKLCLNAGTQNAPYINVNQYDEGEQWIFDLYTEGGQKFTPSTGAIIGIKSDGNAILNSGTVNSGGQVVITETQQMTAASGLAVFELLIEGETHGTANFIVNVERRPSDDAEFSDSDLSLLQEAVNSASEIEDLLGGQDVPTVITPIISDWLDENITNPSNPPIDTSLTVAGAAADSKKVGDEITDLKSAIDNVGYVASAVTASEYTTGYRANVSNDAVVFDSSTSWEYAKLSCSAGDVISVGTFYASNASLTPYLVFTDDDDAVISTEIPAVSTQGYSEQKFFTVPNGATTVYVNSYKIYPEQVMPNRVSVHPAIIKYTKTVMSTVVDNNTELSKVLNNPVLTDKDVTQTILSDRITSNTINAVINFKTTAIWELVSFSVSDVDAIEYSIYEVANADVVASIVYTANNVIIALDALTPAVAGVYTDVSYVPKLADTVYIKIYDNNSYTIKPKVYANINENVRNIADVISPSDTYTGYYGGNVDGSISGGSQAYWQTKKYPVNEGDTYYADFVISSNSNTYGITFTDENGVIMSNDFGGSEVKRQVKQITAPIGAKWLYLKSYLNSTPSYGGECYLYASKINNESFIDVLDRYKGNFDGTTIYASRQGQIDGCPENSIIGFSTARKYGIKMLRGSVTFTADSVPVLFHDEYLGSFSKVYDSNGNLVTDVTKLVSDYTYAELQQYDFGLYAGSKYAGLKICTAEDFIKLCKRLGCDCVLELKYVYSNAEIDVLRNLVALNGMAKNTYYNITDHDRADYLVSVEPKCKLCIAVGNTASAITENIIYAGTLVNGTNDIYVGIGNNTAYTNEHLIQARNLGLGVYYASVYGYSAMDGGLCADIVEVANVHYPHFYNAMPYIENTN